MRGTMFASASVLALVTAAPVAAQTVDQVPNPTAHTDTGTETPPSSTSGNADPNARLGVTPSADDGSNQDIVVRGIRASLEKQAQIKRDNLNVVDSIVADDIGKFPDRTVAAALQRVPGVQVTVGDNNEIVNPIVRGLPDVLTLLDGREIFTGTGRGFSYQDLPAEALAGADVYKSSSADLIEGGVAGIINLRLHKPFDFDGLTIAGNARAIYTRNTQEVNPVVGLLVSDRKDTGIGEIGGLIDVSYSHNEFDRPIAFNCDMRSGNEGPPGAAGLVAPTCVGGLNNQGEYEREQVNASFQWRPAPDLEFYANGLYTAYRSKWASVFLIDDVFGASSFTNVTKTNDCRNYLVNSAGFFDPNGTSQNLCTVAGFTANNHDGFTSTQAHFDRTQVYVIAGGGKWDHGPLSLAADISYQHSRVRDQNFILDTLKTQNTITTVVNGIDIDNGTNYFDTANSLTNPNTFGLSPLNQDNNRAIGHEFAAKVDGHYKVGGVLDELQFGGRYADHYASFQQFLGGTCGVATPVCGTVIAGVPFLGAGFLTNSDGIPTVDGGLGVVAANQDLLRSTALQNQLRALYGLGAGFPDYTPDRAFLADEKTYSGYAQAKYQVPLTDAIKIDGLIGVRYTRTDRSISGAAFVTPAATAAVPNPAPVLTPYSANTSDNDWLPNASARVRFGGGLQARFNYSRAIARPAFGDLNPGLSYLISTNSLILPAGSGGNPNLKPQQSDNFDGTLEYYFKNNGFLAIGGYYKDIKDRVISQSDVEQINGFDYNITRPRNVGKVTLKGIEVSGQTFFDFLPGALAGLGAFGNFTLADSKVNTTSDPLYGYQIQGVSKYNFNAGGLYEKYGFIGRVVYTYRSSYYDENYGGTTLRPAGDTIVLNMVRPNGRLDASLGYEIKKGVTVSIDGTNLTNAKYESYYGLPQFPRDQRFDDSTYSIGITAQF